MFQPTKDKILDHLRDAQHQLAGVLDRSPDEVHALDELDEVIEHIKDIEPLDITSDAPWKK